MRIAVIGAGAVGGYFGARLAAAGVEVQFLARGRHLQALRANGLRLRSVHGDLELPSVNATDDAAAAGPCDVALFCVKSFDTAGAAATHLRLLTVLRDAEIDAQIPPDIRTAMWDKFAFICAQAGRRLPSAGPWATSAPHR